MSAQAHIYTGEHPELRLCVVEPGMLEMPAPSTAVCRQRRGQGCVALLVGSPCQAPERGGRAGAGRGRLGGCVTSFLCGAAQWLLSAVGPAHTALQRFSPRKRPPVAASRPREDGSPPYSAPRGGRDGSCHKSRHRKPRWRGRGWPFSGAKATGIHARTASGRHFRSKAARDSAGGRKSALFRMPHKRRAFIGHRWCGLPRQRGRRDAPCGELAGRRDKCVDIAPARNRHPRPPNGPRPNSDPGGE